MYSLSWSFHPFGEAGLLVEALPAAPEANLAVQALARALGALALPGIASVVPAVHTLLIGFDPLSIDSGAVRRQVERLIDGLDHTDIAAPRVVEIAVRYGGEDGPDLDEIAALLGLAPHEVVAAHCQASHHVLMIGFAPGYPYLGGLPQQLHLPRRATPRKVVPAGSVAIAVGMTGIYPARLPGGWHLIGRTEQGLFDPSAERPCLLDPGDGVRFVALPGGVTTSDPSSPLRAGER
jgi:KipI family sensor histidine kinase inhibitor